MSGSARVDWELARRRGEDPGPCPEDLQQRLAETTAITQGLGELIGVMESLVNTLESVDWDAEEEPANKKNDGPG